MSQAIRTIEPTDTGRLAEVGELTALAYLADGLVDQAHPYIPQLRDARARAEHADLLAMLDGEDGSGRVLGTITLVRPGSPFIEVAQGDEFELRMLAVSPVDRGRGVGRELAEGAMKRAVELGAPRVVLSTMDTMHAAHRLYERLGFERREDLDWYVTDNEDGTVEKVAASHVTGEPACATRGVRLLGYSWVP